MTDEKSTQLSSDSLQLCPCGQTPSALWVYPSNTCKYAYVSGDCCGEWNLEFRTEYNDLDSDACMNLAIHYWNHAVRG